MASTAVERPASCEMARRCGGDSRPELEPLLPVRAWLLSGDGERMLEAASRCPSDRADALAGAGVGGAATDIARVRRRVCVGSGHPVTQVW